MTTYIFYIRGEKLKITHETFWFIEQRAKGEIPDKFYRYAIRHDPNVIEFQKETKIPWATLYVWILDAYENKKYKLLWAKILAVKTYAYKGPRERHIECRFLTDVDEQYKDKEEFIEFCEDCLNMFMECMGYLELIEHSEKLYLGVQVVEVYEDIEDKRVKFYVEIYDYDYDRYPFYAEGTFEPKYWLNLSKAFADFVDQACSESVTVSPWKYQSEIESDVEKLFGKPEDRGLE